MSTKRERRTKSYPENGLPPVEESNEEFASFGETSNPDSPLSSVSCDLGEIAKLASITAQRNLLAQQLASLQLERENLLSAQDTLKKEVIELKEELASRSPKEGSFSNGSKQNMQILHGELNRLKGRESGLPSLLKQFDNLSGNSSFRKSKDVVGGPSINGLKQQVDDLNIEILRLRSQEDKLEKTLKYSSKWQVVVRKLLIKKTKAEKQALEAEKQFFYERVNKLEDDLRIASDKAKELAEKSVKLQADATEAEKKAMKLSHELLASKVVRERTVRSLSAEVADLQEELERTKKLATAQADELDKEQAAVMKWKSVMSIALTKKLEEAKASLESLEEAKNQAEEEASLLLVEKNELDKRLSMLQNELEVTGARMAVLVDRTTRAENSNASLKEQLAATKAEAESIATASVTRIEALKNEISILKGEGRNDVHGAVIASSGFVDAVAKELDIVQKQVKKLEAEKHLLALKLQEVEKKKTMACFIFPYPNCLWERSVQS